MTDQRCARCKHFDYLLNKEHLGKSCTVSGNFIGVDCPFKEA